MSKTTRSMLIGAAAAALAGPAAAQEPVQVGLVLPMTGPFASTGRQVEAGARLYLEQQDGSCGGQPVELLVKDDTGVADITKRIAQELVVREGADVLAGFGLTPIPSSSCWTSRWRGWRR